MIFNQMQRMNNEQKTQNYPASENPNLVRSLLGGGQDDTVGRRYRRAEIERGEADAIQENGDPERMGYMNIELWNKPRFKYQWSWMHVTSRWSCALRLNGDGSGTALGC
jgi:hypothetical protein